MVVWARPRVQQVPARSKGSIEARALENRRCHGEVENSVLVLHVIYQYTLTTRVDGDTRAILSLLRGGRRGSEVVLLARVSKLRSSWSHALMLLFSPTRQAQWYRRKPASPSLRKCAARP